MNKHLNLSFKNPFESFRSICIILLFVILIISFLSCAYLTYLLTKGVINIDNHSPKSIASEFLSSSGISADLLKAHEVKGTSLIQVFLDNGENYLIGRKGEVVVVPSPKGINVIDIPKGQSITSDAYVEIFNDFIGDINTIEFKSDNEKGRIFVFVDVQCTYCKKFHRESLTPLIESGVTVHYIPTPMFTGSDVLAQRALCSPVPHKEYSLITNTLSSNSEELRLKHDNSSDYREAYEHFVFGLIESSKDTVGDCKKEDFSQSKLLFDAMGIAGTPAIVLPDGVIFEGAVPAKDIIEAMNL